MLIVDVKLCSFFRCVKLCALILLETSALYKLFTYLVTVLSVFACTESTERCCWLLGRRDEPKPEIYCSDSRHICGLGPSRRSRTWSRRAAAAAEGQHVSTATANDLERPCAERRQRTRLPKSFITLSSSWAAIFLGWQCICIISFNILTANENCTVCRGLFCLPAATTVGFINSPVAHRFNSSPRSFGKPFSSCRAEIY